MAMGREQGRPRGRSSFWLAAALLICAGSGASAQDIGFEGPSYAGALGWPTGEKTQSKLWWNDGLWWGCLWSSNSQAFMIHGLEPVTQTWVETGAAVDGRPNSRADCLWNGTKLYVASHRFTTGSGIPGQPLQVYRYSYNPVAKVYSLDTGFPVLIGNYSTEALVIDQDSTGALWVVWKQDFRIWYAHTLGDDRVWTSPAIHPRSTVDLDSDDLGTLARFGGNKIGVMWSDDLGNAYRFSAHVDGDPGTVWSAPELALSEPVVDDHIHLRGAADGRVFAAIKTTTDEVRLLVRSVGGSWTSHLVADAIANWTRVICLLDEEHQEVHLYGTSPILGGTIYRKVSDMNAIAFPGGIGTAVIRKDGDATHIDVTSTKQALGGATGLVVAACHQGTQRVWHHFDDLGGATPAPPVASFAADPIEGYTPLEVQFIDNSSNAPTSWSWNFGDGATSTQRHPVHVYQNPGQYTVTLDVSNALGQDSLVRSNLVDVTDPPAVLVLEALEDAHVRELSPTTNYAAEAFLRVRDDPSSDFHAYVKFFVPPTGKQIAAATLRLFVLDESSDGGAVHEVSNGWNESVITWNNAPPIAGPPVGDLGATVLGTWVELDVSSAVTGNGTHCFGIQSGSSNSAIYSSRQGANPPQLVLDLEDMPLEEPIADFEANRTKGIRPLTVLFSDTSIGIATSWLWTFGDGGVSTLQNPSHDYQHPGRYTVSLRVANSAGIDIETKVDFIRVTQPTRTWDDPVGNGTSVLLPLSAAGGPLEKRRPASIENAIRRALPGGFPLPTGGAGFVEKESSELRLELVLEGTLEDALEFYEEALPERGFEIVRRSVERGDGRARGVLLQLRGRTGSGALELRSAKEGVEATLFLDVR